MHIIENEYIKICIASDGNLEELLNCKNGRNAVNPHRILRCILEDEECLEFEAVPDGKPDIYSTGSNIILRWSRLRGEQGNVYDIDIEADIALSHNIINWSIKINNRSLTATVRECHYPVISINHPEPPLAVINSELVSTRIDDLPAFIELSFTDYMAPDQKYIRHSEAYPGKTCSLNCFLLDWGDDGFYYGCHDDSFDMTVHSLESENDRINCFMARLPFLAPGQSMHENVITTALYSGDWMNGARIYRKWVDEWFAAPLVPEHIRKMSGWQRVIMHHQYGEYFFRYKDLEKIYDNGAKAGIDTLFLFGWTAEGMDAGYPAYTPDPSQGGFNELKKNILKVREKGGHVILYFNGQLIDAASEYYREGKGRHVSIKRADGTEHREFYNFSNTGTFLRLFGNKTFAVACPACRDWLEVLKRHIDFAIEVGADSVFFDQLGLASYPCCDPSHGHPIPFTGLMAAKREMLRELYEYTKSKARWMGFGIECTTDQTVQYTDFVHIFGNIAQSWDESWRQSGAIPRQKSGAYFFKAVMPESIISNRNIRDDSEVEFPVNRMFLLGSRSDVEIYRCRADLSATPRYQEYLRKANILREKFADILYNGIFSNRDYHSIDNPAVQTNSFRLEDQLAVIVTQSSEDHAEATVSVPAYRLESYDSINRDIIVDRGKVIIPRNGLAVLIYRKM